MSRDGRRAGFTLIELVVSLVVMAGIMSAVLSHVWYASLVWRRTQQAITINNQVVMVHRLLQNEMFNAVKLSSPSSYVGSYTPVLEYDVKVASAAGGS